MRATRTFSRAVEMSSPVLKLSQWAQDLKCRSPYASRRSISATNTSSRHVAAWM